MRTRLARALAMLAVVAAPAAHAEVTVGVPSAIPGQCVPFGCYLAQTRYQQVYAASEFPGAMTIASLTFHREPWPAAGEFAPGLFTFRLSLTSRPANDLLLGNLDDNVAGPQQAFAAIAVGGLVPDAWTVSGTPFTYEPSKGNLLLDVLYVPNAPSSEPHDAYFQGDSLDEITSAVVTVAFESAPPFTFPLHGGLVTTFDGIAAPPATTAPEPASVALLGAGLAALGVVMRRRSGA